MTKDKKAESRSRKHQCRGDDFLGADGPIWLSIFYAKAPLLPLVPNVQVSQFECL